jgi:hypothetical protein
MLKKLAEAFTNVGPITFMIRLVCICILYLFFYFAYMIYKFLCVFLWLMPGPGVTFFTYVVMDFIAYLLFQIALLILASLGTLFLVLYIVYKVVQKMGFGFILDGTSFFSECWSSGLFGLFDDIFGILDRRDYIWKKLGPLSDAIYKFLKTYMKDSFGIVFEGYELDDEYLDAAFEVFKTKQSTDKNVCEAKKEELKHVLSRKQPVIRIKFNENVPPEEATSKNMSQMDIIKMNNCIRSSTVEIPQDANTIERLQLIFKNELAKKTCYAQMQRESLEKTVQDIGDSISSSVDSSMKTFSAGFTKHYEKNNADLEKSKSK